VQRASFLHRHTDLVSPAQRILGQAPKPNRSLGTARLFVWERAFGSAPPVDKKVRELTCFLDATLNTSHFFLTSN
ncbi:hypothetical protein, partial [Vibrio sp. 1866]|uniref:hypothetical protein n=1 Tax=Vibrio sp. 1866 TaxID=3074581 RepID=UPI0029648AD3